MSKKRHNLVHVARHVSGWQVWPVDQNDRDAPGPSRIELGPRTGTARVLRHNQKDPVIHQQAQILRLGEGAARDDGFRVGQRQSAFGRVDKAQKVMVLGLCTEGREVLLSDSEEDPSGRLGKCFDGGTDIRNDVPVVARAGRPRRAFKGAERRPGFRASRDGIATHLCGEGVRCIDDMGDAFGPDVFGQSLRATEATDPSRQGLRKGCARASGIGEDGIRASLGQSASQSARFGRAAEEKDARHG